MDQNKVFQATIDLMDAVCEPTMEHNEAMVIRSMLIGLAKRRGAMAVEDGIRLYLKSNWI